jgi:hypothetical protein
MVMTGAKILRITLTLLLTAAITCAHLFYSWWLSLRLYQWSGGIRKLPSGWTEFGGASFAWSIPLELPGNAILRLCQIYSRSDCNGTLEAQIGMSLTLLPSLIIAYLIAVILVGFATKQPISLGRFYWRAVVIALGLIWIPVREDFAPVFQYTVMY